MRVSFITLHTWRSFLNLGSACSFCSVADRVQSMARSFLFGVQLSRGDTHFYDVLDGDGLEGRPELPAPRGEPFDYIELREHAQNALALSVPRDHRASAYAGLSEPWIWLVLQCERCAPWTRRLVHTAENRHEGRILEDGVERVILSDIPRALRT